MHIATGAASATTDPAARALYEYLAEREKSLQLESAQVFFNFPLYRDDDQLVSCKMLLVSSRHGVVVIGTSNATQQAQLSAAASEISAAFNQLYARLFKNPRLKMGMKSLRLAADALLFAPDASATVDVDALGVPVARNLARAEHFLNDIPQQALSKQIFDETLSTIEGAKGLIRPRERNVSDEFSKAASVSRLEEETNRFDLSQLEAYASEVRGLERICGLAGSGKTVVLAMKAAITHLRHPKAKIAFTFHTKSLYQHVRRLITRFYRQYDDQDPNWEVLHVIHAWGGRATPGIYSNACASVGVQPMTFAVAAGAPGKSPFDNACSTLLASSEIEPAYDYIFVDEGQDFRPSFLQLCLRLARDQNVVLAYDQLQSIFEANIPKVREILGREDVELSSDITLKKCYRNPLEILVCAHAIGFGLYGEKIRQMIEDEDHWAALGYEVIAGPLKPGIDVRIRRPKENSPSSISDAYPPNEIVKTSTFATLTEEANWVADGITEAIRKDSLKPEDILVIAADDRNAKTYLQAISDRIGKAGIRSNNLQIDAFGVQDFLRDEHVTLTTIHKAKGNEAYLVFIVGVDALFLSETVRNRNMAFTAMTRAKAWVRISGIGAGAESLGAEVRRALDNLPDLVFRYPSPEDLAVMKRDLLESDAQRVARVLSGLRAELPQKDFVRLIQEQLRLEQATSRGESGDKGKPRER